MDRYSQRGVSSKKEDVHNAISKIDKGLFPTAFCKIVPDLVSNDDRYCNVMHSDGAGTKSSLAYIYYKETGDLSVFKGIAMDSIVMNTDDLLCVGIVDNILISSTIGRNQKLISGEIIKKIIESTEEICDEFKKLGINVISTGGETADVGDLVRTVIVDTTAVARIERKNIIDNKNIKPNMAIVGLSSYGKATYEEKYNSGISSNGLTSARHDLLSKIYKTKYPESFNPLIDDNLVYSGKYLVTDRIDSMPIDIGSAILSPTRTYLPIMREVIERYHNKIGGIIHCSGGGQTKSLKSSNNIHFVKDSLFPIPPIFKLILDETETSLKEAYSVFNMGHRLEIYTDEKSALDIIDISKKFDVEAKIIGYTEKSNENRLTIKNNGETLEYK